MMSCLAGPFRWVRSPFLWRNLHLLWTNGPVEEKTKNTKHNMSTCTSINVLNMIHRVTTFQTT